MIACAACRAQNRGRLNETRNYYCNSDLPLLRAEAVAPESTRLQHRDAFMQKMLGVG